MTDHAANRHGDSSRFAHPGFQDMTGQTVAGALVVRRVANAAGNARWLVLAACGHEATVEGIALRGYAKEGRQFRCRPCRAPRQPNISEVAALKADKATHPEKYSKVCTKCGAEKSLLEFSINRATADGRQYRCKPCDKLALLATERKRLDHKRKGLPPPRLGKFCGYCCGLPHQRPIDGCPGCGLPFQAEDLTAARAEVIERRRVVERG